MDVDDEAASRDERLTFTFTNKTTTLDDQYKMSQGLVKVNVKECMKVVTTKADFNEVIEDQFIMHHKRLNLKLASTEESYGFLTS